MLTKIISDATRKVIDNYVQLKYYYYPIKISLPSLEITRSTNAYYSGANSLLHREVANNVNTRS